jgi:hypothetical protein
VIKATNEKAIEDADTILLNRLTMTSQNFPISPEKINQIVKGIQTEALAAFLNRAINIDKHREYQEKLENIFTERFNEFQAKNLESSRHKCESLLQRHFTEVEARINADEFAQPGGYKLLKIAIQNLEIKYNSETK